MKPSKLAPLELSTWVARILPENSLPLWWPSCRLVTLYHFCTPHFFPHLHSLIISPPRPCPLLIVKTHILSFRKWSRLHRCPISYSSFHRNDQINKLLDLNDYHGTWHCSRLDDLYASRAHLSFRRNLKRRHTKTKTARFFIFLVPLFSLSLSILKPTTKWIERLYNWQSNLIEQY
jgi:hypothetical protein